MRYWPRHGARRRGRRSDGPRHRNRHSQAMVDAVQAAATARGVFTQVAAVRQDAEELVLEPDTFDVALCAFGLMYVVDPIQALRRLHDALRPVAARPWPCGAPARPVDGRRSFRSSTDGSDPMSVLLFFQLGTGNALRSTL